MPLDIRLLKLEDRPVFTDLLAKNVASYTILSQKFGLSPGIVPLVQAFLSNLLTTAGTDVLQPLRGAGVISMSRRHRTHSLDIVREMTVRIREVERFMFEEQRLVAMTAEEQLAGVDIIAITPGPNPDMVTVDLNIRSRAGAAARIAL